MKEQVLQLLITLGDGDDLDAGQRALAARLLRDAADRIEHGHPHGGFHFGRHDSTPGGFAFMTVDKGKPLRFGP